MGRVSQNPCPRIRGCWQEHMVGITVEMVQGFKIGIRSPQNVCYPLYTKDSGLKWRNAEMAAATALLRALCVTELSPMICYFNYHSSLRRYKAPGERVEVQRVSRWDTGSLTTPKAPSSSANKAGFQPRQFDSKSCTWG